MPFHRLTVPSYFGGLPGGYNYINNAVSGTPAYADGQKSMGPNVGTYFLAFNEEATNRNANRGLKALAENTDLLDDLIRRDVAVPRKTLDTVAGVGGVGSITLTGPVYVGDAGTPSTVAGIRSFVQVVDSDDNEIFNGTECQVTSITGATPGAVWSAGDITLNISPVIPDGVTYRVYYSVRGSNAGILPGDLVFNRRQYGRYNGGVNWADGTTNPATSVTGQLDKILSELASTTGAMRIGKAAVAGSPVSLGAGSAGTQINTLHTELNNEINARVALDATHTADIAFDTARLTTLANIAALQAIAAPTNGLIRHVQNKGLYRFDSGAGVLSADSPFVFAATDLTPGKWIFSGYDHVATADGFARLQSARQLRVHGVTPSSLTDFPTFDVPRTPVRQVNLSCLTTTVALATRAKTATFNPAGGILDTGAGDVEYIRIQSGTLTFPEISASFSMGAQFPIDHYLVDGATISSVVASFAGASGHAALPGTQASIGVFRKHKTATTLVSLRSAGDFVDDAQASTGAYQAQHTFTYTPDQNNVVDKSTYSYFIQFWNEFGTNVVADSKLYGIEIQMTAVNVLGFY